MALPPNALVASSPAKFVPKTFFASLGNNVKPNLADCYNSADDTGSMAQCPTLASSPSDHFSFANDHEQPSTDDDFGNAHAQNLRLLKHMLLSKEREDPLEGLAMIDAIQRLGVEYHFEEEINAILERHYDFTITAGISHQHDNNDDLLEVALRFRLLRQEGYYVPQGVFEKFKDEEGKFEQELNGDIEGIMSLYEASQLRVRGEDMLDEAEDHCYRLLSSRKLHLDNDKAKAVENTLGHPHHKSLARFMANDFLNSLQGTKGWINALKEFAKVELSMARSQYQREIIQISKWWKNLGLSKELTFARNEPLKWYIWSLACLTDPSLSEQRIELTKPISLIYVIDDIFDVYGTLNELTLFTEVVNGWDIAAADKLPHCMKICFKALNSITDEISHKVHTEHGWNPIHSLRKVWASLCRSFLVEAKWFASGKLPNTEEYLKNGIVSSGVHVALVHMFFLLGQGINKESVELIENNPGIVSYTATILRLWDDLGSAKDEDQDGHDGSYVECYMQEHQGCLFETAKNHVINMIRDAWKNLNQECLSPSPFSATFQKASLNAARMVPLMYSYDDSHRLPTLQQHMKFLLYGKACTRE